MQILQSLNIEFLILLKGTLQPYGHNMLENDFNGFKESFVDELITYWVKKHILNNICKILNIIFRGKVQESTFAVLPNIPPTATFFLTFIAQVPALIQLVRRPNNPLVFVRCLVLCAFASFLFGW